MTISGKDRDRDVAGRLTYGAMLVRAGEGLGSAVMMGDSILTAAHVVLPADGHRHDLDKLVFDVGTGRRRSKGVLVAYEEVYDIAVLRPLAPAQLQDIPRFTLSSDAHIGDPIWVGGYPFGTEVPVVRRGSIASIVMPEEATVVDRNMFVSSQASFPAYWIDVPIFPGNSGGPVLNAEGELIGLANQTIHHNHEFEDSFAEIESVPVYLDVGIAIRLDLALPWSGLDKHLSNV